MSHLDPPRLEADIPIHQISDRPVPGEFGAHTFGRLITIYLAGLLHCPITATGYRCNPFDRRSSQRAQSYEFTAARHQVTVVYFEATLDGSYDVLPTFAILLDGGRVPFDPHSYQQIEWQIARSLYLAITGRRCGRQPPLIVDGRLR